MFPRDLRGRLVWCGSGMAAGLVCLILLAGTTAGGDLPPDPSQESAVDSASSQAVCDTRPGREEEVIDLYHRRTTDLEQRGLTPSAGRDRGSLLDVESSGLDDLLGPDGNIERGVAIDVDDITVLVDDGAGIFGTFQTGFEVDIVRAARQYYQWFPDDVDTLSLMPGFAHESGTFQLLIRNDVQGINRPTLDDSAIYGSAGRLQSVLLFSNYLDKPANPLWRIPGNHNTPVSLMAHEFGHRFSAFARFDLDSGPGVVASNRLLGRGLAHWCFFLDSQSAFTLSGVPNMSALEGNEWRLDVLGGTWTTAGATDGYSPLDLYLMGLMAPEDVPPMTLLTGSSGIDSPPTLPGGAPAEVSCVSSPVSVPPQSPVTLVATPREITMADILAVEGPRIPDHNTSQKDFRQALVLVVRQGRFPTPRDIRRLKRLREAWEPYFTTATGGRGSVDTARATRPGETAAFALVRFPDDIQAGRPLSLGLMALDADGRVATGFTGEVRLTSATDPAAAMPSIISFTAADAGYLLIDEPILFTTGGVHTLTATAVADGNVTGTRREIAVEGPVEVQCIPEPRLPDDASSKPWGAGATFSGLGGVRFQYLIHSRAIGRPGVILNLDWPVESSPEGVQWESMAVKMAHRSVYDLDTQNGEADLDRNLSTSLDVTTVAFGPREQRGMQESGRVHLTLDEPFQYNGIDHLLIDLRYTGGGPAGLQTTRSHPLGDVITVERLGPNSPVQINKTATVCLGTRIPSGDPPVISGVTVAQVRNTTADISWITSPETDGRVEYGLPGDPPLGVTETDRFGLSHVVNINGLSPDTEYEAVAISRDFDAQEVRSEPLRFRTSNLQPKVFGISPNSVRRNTFSKKVLVSGANFFEGVIAELVTPDLEGPDPPTLDPDVFVVFVQRLSDNILDIRVTVEPWALLGPRRLKITNGDGFVLYSDTFLGVLPPTEANDIDASGRVDGFDLSRLARAFGASFGDPRYSVEVDLDGDGDVDGLDLARLANNFGRRF